MEEQISNSYQEINSFSNEQIQISPTNLYDFVSQQKNPQKTLTELNVGLMKPHNMISNF